VARRLPALLLCLPLAACGGGGKSDKEKITSLIVQGGRTPATLCDHLDAPTLVRLGGRSGCLSASRAKDAKDPGVKVDSGRIDGDKATAKITGRGGGDTVHLVKRDGDWKITGGR
jgi:hypothetical protein